MRKRLGLIALLSVVVAVASVAAQSQSPPTVNKLTVHEWGTFTSVAGANGHAVEWIPLNGPSELPCFVKNLNAGFNVKVPIGGLLNQMKATVRMETPVVYFYSPLELTAHVWARFPQGMISEWYPQASVAPLYPNNGVIADTTGSIEWRDVKVLPSAKPALINEDGLSHYYAARATDSAPIQVGSQMEKFLFYRGIASFPVPISAALDEKNGAVTITNNGGSPIPTAILFENQNGRLGYSIVSDISKATLIPRPALTKDFATMRRDVETTLTARGLFPREAKAMIETWSDSWFSEGARLFYIVPSSSLERILPLTIQPEPSEITRVFVGRVEIFTPEVQNEVERAIKTNNLPTLAKYGRFLDPIVNSISPRLSAAERTQATAALRAVAAWFEAAAAEHACK